MHILLFIDANFEAVLIAARQSTQYVVVVANCSFKHMRMSAAAACISFLLIKQV